MFQNYTAMQNCGAIPTNGLVGGGASRVFAQPRAQGRPREGLPGELEA